MLGKKWMYHLLEDSVRYFQTTGNDRAADLVESTPFGLLGQVFKNCSTIYEVENRCEVILDALDDDCIVEIHEPYDDDSDWLDE